MSEPRLRTKLKILTLGLLVPVLTVFATYEFLVTHLDFAMFGLAKLRSTYLRDLNDQRVGRDYPPVDLVVLGDSTAKVGFNPTEIHSIFAVNLAVHGGTNVVSYATLTEYLKTHPAPRCVFLLSQENWHRNYGMFFSKVIFQNYLSWDEIRSIWQTGAANHIFPASEMSWFEYHTRSLLALLELNPPPLAQLQEALKLGSMNAERRSDVARFTAQRGWHAREDSETMQRKFFDPHMHEMYVNRFTASASEDFYLHRIVELGRARGFRVLFGSSPMAESFYVRSSERFQHDRDSHLQKILQDEPALVYLPLPRVFPQQLHSDLNHLNAEGARVFARELEPQLKSYCRPPDAT